MRRQIRKKQDRAAFQEREKVFLGGIDYMKAERLKIHAEVELRWYQYFQRCFWYLIDKITPLKKAIKRVEGAHNKSI